MEYLDKKVDEFYILKSAVADLTYLICTCMYITLKINFRIITYSDGGSNTISWSDTSKGQVSPFLFPDHKKSKMSQSTNVDLDGQVSPVQDT